MNQHKVSIKFKNGSNTRSAKVLIYGVYEYNSALPAGKLEVSNRCIKFSCSRDSQGKTNGMKMDH